MKKILSILMLVAAAGSMRAMDVDDKAAMKPPSHLAGIVRALRGTYLGTIGSLGGIDNFKADFTLDEKTHHGTSCAYTLSLFTTTTPVIAIPKRMETWENRTLELYHRRDNIFRPHTIAICFLSNNKDKENNEKPTLSAYWVVLNRD